MIARVLRPTLRLLLTVVGLVSLVWAPTRDGRGELPPTPLADGGSWPLVKTWIVRALIVLTVVGVMSGIVVLAGGVPLRASSGHWAITAWLLDFAKVRAVRTQSMLVDVPPLDEERLIVMGAGQFEGACLPCHGGPGIEQPRIAGGMTPRPPNLAETVRRFAPAELFYIVKHGIKFTGMPAWPAQGRDDEVWAVVAFLRTLPGMDVRAYEALARGRARARASEAPPIDGLVPPAAIAHVVVGTCGRCHGLDGDGRGLGAFPRLAGQRASYLRATLEAYKGGRRHSGFMEPIAAALGADDIQAIAAYFAGLPRASADDRAEDADSGAGDDTARGQSIAFEGIPGRDVPACISCHGPTTYDRNPHYPRLAGQYAAYLELQLRLFKRRARGGTGYAPIMHRVVEGLGDDDIRAVAAFFASVPHSEDGVQ
ncbi:MAG: c-type cytochrome [Vicinamibacterales bacterium]